jgi:sec-independent protein translocase protein TatC
MIVAFIFIDRIFTFVFQPIRAVLPPGSRLIYTQPGEAFSVYVQIALIAGVVFAAPFVMYQMWRLVAPALYLHQKRLAVPFILLTTGGFVGGALFNHYVVFQWMIAFFGSFSSFNLAFLPRLADVFGLYTKMLFGMGLVFQMPAVVYFLARMGLVTARFLTRNLKYAVFLIFVIAAVITPTGDVTVQTLFALPMVGLYILSIVIAWMVGPAARRVED